MTNAIMLKDVLLISAEVIGAATIVFGAVFTVYRWVLKQNRQDKDIKDLKKEQTVICYGVLAALKGLSEQGCNGPVTLAIDKLEKHLNVQAHR